MSTSRRHGQLSPGWKLNLRWMSVRSYPKVSEVIELCVDGN